MLCVTVSFFYNDVAGGVKGRNAHGESEDVAGNKDPLAQCETFELVRARHKTRSLPVRKRVFELFKSPA